MTIIILHIVLPGHGLSGEELQLIVVQAEAVEGEQASERLRCQVVQGVMAETKPLDVLQALEEKSDCCRIVLPNTIIHYGEQIIVSVLLNMCVIINQSWSTWKAILGMYTSWLWVRASMLREPSCVKAPGWISSTRL